MAIDTDKANKTELEPLHAWEVVFFKGLKKTSFNWSVIGVTTYTKDKSDNNDDLLENIRSIYQDIINNAEKFKKIVVEKKGKLYWSDCKKFDLNEHITIIDETVVREKGINRIVEDKFEQPFNKNRPYWYVYIVDDQKNNQYTTISNIHHGLIQSYPMVLSKTFNDREYNTNIINHSPKKLADLKNTNQLDQKKPPSKLHELLKVIVSFGHLMAIFVSIIYHQRNTINHNVVGTKRKIALVHTDRSLINTIKKDLNCTFNDVLVAIFARALTSLLISRGYTTKEISKFSTYVALPVSSIEKNGECPHY